MIQGSGYQKGESCEYNQSVLLHNCSPFGLVAVLSKISLEASVNGLVVQQSGCRRNINQLARQEGCGKIAARQKTHFAVGENAQSSRVIGNVSKLATIGHLKRSAGFPSG
jgi:hypothetical protein